MSSLRNVAKMTPEAIKSLVYNDFDRVVDIETAEEIRDAAKKGCLVWSGKHLTTVDSSNIRIIHQK